MIFKKFEIKRGMGNTSKEDFLKIIGIRLVVAKKVRNNCDLFIDKGLNNLGEFFKGAGLFSIPESIILCPRKKNAKFWE